MDDYAAQAEAMRGTGTAASVLADTLRNLAASENAASQAAKIAAATGKELSAVRAAMSRANAAAAAEERRLANEQRAAARDAAKSAAAAERAAAQQAKATERAAAAAEREKTREAKAAERAASQAAKAEERQGAAMVKSRENAAKIAIAKIREQTKAQTEARRQEQIDHDRWAESVRESEQAATAAIGRTAVGMALAFDAAIAAAIARMAQFAIVASAARTKMEGALGALLGAGPRAGAEMAAQFDRLGNQLGLTTAQVNAMAQPLLQLKASAADVEGAIKAIAASTAIMGEAGGAATQGLYADLLKLANLRQRVVLSPDMQARLAAAGVSAKALAKELGVNEDRLRFVALNAKGLGDVMQRILLRQGAGALQAMGHSWDTMSAKAKEGIMSAFEGLGKVVDPFMTQLQLLFGNFNRGAHGAGVLSAVVKGVLEPAFRTATAVVRGLHIALLTVEIYGLRAYIALRPLWAILARLEVGAKATWLAMYLLKGTLITLGVIFGALTVAVGLVALPFVVLGIAISAVVSAVQTAYGALSGAVSNIDNIKSAIMGSIGGWAESAAKAAVNIPVALAQSLLEGTGQVAAAMTKLATSALSSFTGVFQIRSPSRVMKKHGKENIAEKGLGEGLDEGSDAVNRSMVNLLAPPKPEGGKGGKGGKGLSLTFNNCHFGGGMTKEKLWDWIEEWMEIQASGGPEEEPA